MNYFELYPGDYLRDTTHLSLAEHGAYLLMMVSYYGSEKPLPSEMAKLFRMTGAVSKAEREAVKEVAEKFFPFDENGLRRNKRADLEIAKARKRINSSKENGKLGGRPNKETQQDTHRVISGIPNNNPPETHSGEALHTPHAIPHQDQKISTANAVEVTDTSDDLLGERISNKPKREQCPIAAIIDLYHECLPNHPRLEKRTAKREGYIRARWSEDLPTLDAWRNYFTDVSSSRFMTGKVDPKPGNRRFIATLEWLTKAENFAKVSEGEYHR